MTSQSDVVTVTLTGHLAFIVILGVVLAALLSGALLLAYRRAVVRSMRRSAAEEWAGSRSDGARPVVAGRGEPLRVEVMDPRRRDPERTAEADRLYRAAIRSPYRTAAVYATGGSAYAAIMAASFLVASGIGFLPLRFLILFWCFAWPAVCAFLLVAGSRRRPRLAVAGGYFGVLIVLGALAIARSADSSAVEIAGLWTVANLPATLLLTLFLQRRIRAVGPIVLVLTVFGVGGTSFLLSGVVSSDSVLRVIVEIGLRLGLGAGGILVVLIGLGFAVFGGLVGRGAVGWIARAYERKRLSDQAVVVHSVWAIFAFAHSVGLVFAGPAWILSGGVAFAAYAVVVRAGHSRITDGGTARDPGPRLLLLRVFSLGRRSERLFHRLALHWRHVGHMWLIAGPDLATATVEPHEFLDFLGGRLDRRFIGGPAALAERVGAIDDARDPDGRYRVHDFFCFDDAWRAVLRELVGGSDVVMMDLRGFSRSNEGCLYEIQELFDQVPLDRVLILVDASTDEAFLRSAMEAAWRAAHPDSPNRTYEHPPSLRLFRVGGAVERDLRRLLGALCAAARPAEVSRGAAKGAVTGAPTASARGAAVQPRLSWPLQR